MEEKKRVIATLCGQIWKEVCCPVMSLNPKAEASKQIEIADDFGNTVFMSKDQLKSFVSKAKKGEISI